MNANKISIPLADVGTLAEIIVALQVRGARFSVVIVTDTFVISITGA